MKQANDQEHQTNTLERSVDDDAWIVDGVDDDNERVRLYAPDTGGLFEISRDGVVGRQLRGTCDYRCPKARRAARASLLRQI